MSEREDFEGWVNDISPMFPIMFDLDPAGERYVNDAMQDLWRCWQARAALENPADGGIVSCLQMMTTLDLPPAQVLRGAIKADLAIAVVVGQDAKGAFYFASSASDTFHISFLLDAAKQFLLDQWQHRLMQRMGQ